jgi:hypothetical protein
MAQYAIDLSVSVGLVLLLGWAFQASASDVDLRDALVGQNDVFAAINRFTPRYLINSYASTIDPMTRNLLLGFSPSDSLSRSAGQGFTAAVLLLVQLALAVPRTMLRVYQETSGGAAWVVLIGFGMAISTVFTWLLAAKTTLWRLLLATALSPIAISVVFSVLQAFMVLMLNAFFWFTAFASYAVACPVLCTVYWIVFPNADRGATMTLARAIGRMLER